MNELLVSVDLGSVTFGGAGFSKSGLLWVQSWKLRGGSNEHPGARWQRLREILGSLERPTQVAYEKVAMHASSTLECAAKCGRLREPEVTRHGRNLMCRRCGSSARRVQRMNVAAAHAYGAGEAMLMEWCFTVGVVPVEVHTSAVKAAATGKGGGAGTAKADIVAAAHQRWPGVTFPTPDAADAAFVGLAAARSLGWAQLKP